MSLIEDVGLGPQTRAGFADTRDVDEFVETLARFERGELTSDAWRAFRLIRGTYGQRQGGDAQMLRVKIPQGLLDAAQLRALGHVADTWSRGFGHVTTRQNVQFHFMRLQDLEPAMRYLAEVGLTTREACGNSVRNITACPYAGVDADEVFDVTPYAEALTRHLLRHALSSTLPRKFKIAFEGCAQGDHVFSAINDIGLRARLDERGRRGFLVTVAGGTATLATSGHALVPFLPADELLTFAEALLAVFHRFGDRQHRQRNRLKFLVRTLGRETFQAAFDECWAALRASAPARLPFDPQAPPEEPAPDGAATRLAWPTPEAIAERVRMGVRSDVPGLVPRVRVALRVEDGARAAWRASNVRPQRQAGFVQVVLRLPLGDVTSAQWRVLADLAEGHGDGYVRTTVDQNALLRWVRIEALDGLYARLLAAGLAQDGAGSLADVTSCPGAESCKLAVTQSRGLGRALAEHLDAQPALVDAATGLDVKISGCPNGCGQHHVAGIGLQGSVRQVAGRAVPQYFVMLGGGQEEGRAYFGRIAAKVPARRVPEAVERLARLFAEQRFVGETGRAFFRRLPAAQVKALLSDLESLPPEQVCDEDYVDLGERTAFTVETQAGECSA
jgi:sulfite reductase (NADPH) hemoprotein beta-component